MKALTPTSDALDLALALFLDTVEPALLKLKDPQVLATMRKAFPDVEFTPALLEVVANIARNETQIYSACAEVLDAHFSPQELAELVACAKVPASLQYMKSLLSLLPGNLSAEDLFLQLDKDGRSLVLWPEVQAFIDTPTGTHFVALCKTGGLIEALTQCGYVTGYRAGVEWRETGFDPQPD